VIKDSLLIFGILARIRTQLKRYRGLTTYLVVGLFCFIAEKLEHLIFHIELG
jgi:hypothetical protein